MTARLFARVSGPASGAPIVFLHGALGTHRDWDPVVEQVPGRLAIAFDLPGHGASPEDSFWTFETWKEAFWSEVRRHTAKAPVLVGYSMGARLALCAAQDRSHAVAGLVLVAVTRGLADESLRPARQQEDAAWADRVRLATTVQARRDLLNAWWRRGVFGRFSEHPAYPEILEERAQRPLERAAETLRNLGTGNMPRLSLDSLGNVPVCCLAGTLDPRYADEATKLAASMALATRVLIPGCGHALLTEAPRVVASEVRHMADGVFESPRESARVQDLHGKEVR